MSIFSKKESVQEKLNKLIENLDFTYKYICPDVIEQIRKYVNDDYKLKYDYGDAKGIFSKLIVKYGWYPILESNNTKYHEEDGRLNPNGVSLLQLAIEHIGKAVEYGVISKEELQEKVAVFCEHYNLYDAEKFRRQYDEEREREEEEYRKDRRIELTKEFSISGPRNIENNKYVSLITLNQSSEKLFLRLYYELFMCFEFYGQEHYIIDLSNNKTYHIFRTASYSVWVDITEHIPNEEYDIKLLGTGKVIDTDEID